MILLWRDRATPEQLEQMLEQHKFYVKKLLSGGAFTPLASKVCTSEPRGKLHLPPPLPCSIVT
ncbi:hypothetical protein FBB35_09195 [Nostoc sp. TCL240-02]|nr:hypothetical protein FBB35_09195 [Nostoc sp. TCL240-02]